MTRYDHSECISWAVDSSERHWKQWMKLMSTPFAHAALCNERVGSRAARRRAGCQDQRETKPKSHCQRHYLGWCFCSKQTATFDVIVRQNTNTTKTSLSITIIIVFNSRSTTKFKLLQISNQIKSPLLKGKYQQHSDENRKQTTC